MTRNLRQVDPIILPDVGTGSIEDGTSGAVMPNALRVTSSGFLRAGCRIANFLDRS